MTGRIVLVAPTRDLTDRARALGVDVFVVTTKARAGLDHIGTAPHTLVVDDFDDEHVLPILAATHARTPFSGCLSLTEYGLEPASRLAAALGVRGVHVAAVQRTRDKSLMRDALDRAGISKVAARTCTDSGQVCDFAAEHGYPVIVKPSAGVGSALVSRVDSPADAAKAFADLDRAQPVRFIVEEYLMGPEYSVECFTVGGQHTTLAVTEKELIGTADSARFVELSHAVPARLTDRDRSAIVELVENTLTVLGVNGGPSHTEVKLTHAGPRVIETHTRVGGDHIPALVQRVTGVDLYEQSVRWAAGLPVDVRGRSGHGGAAIRYLVPRPGVLTSVHGTSRLDSLPGVIDYEVKPATGDTIHGVRRSLDRAGYVMAVGSDTAEALAICADAAEKVRFESDPVILARRPLNT